MKREPIYKIEELEDLTSDFDIKHLLKEHAYQNKPIDFQEGYLLGIYTLFPLRSWLSKLFSNKKGDSLEDRMESAAKRSLATLCTLHNKFTYTQPGAAEQIAGICASIFDYDIALSKNGFLMPNVEFAIDNCGMGGDVLVTPNVSTVAALIAAASGIPICKHGSPKNADGGEHGSSDFMAEMAFGLNSFQELIGIPKEKVEEVVEKFNYGYTEACDTGYKTIHIQTHDYADLPHMNDLIGPITNPLHPRLATKKIIGINQLVEPKTVAEAFVILNEKGVTHVDDGFFVRGYIYQDRKGPENDDGMDEVSIMSGGTHVARLKNGKIEEFNIYAEDFGLQPVEYESICPDERGKGQFSYDILRGEQTGPAKDLILVNAAIIEHLARGTDLKESYRKMKEVLESGAAFENLQNVRDFLQINKNI